MVISSLFSIPDVVYDCFQSNSKIRYIILIGRAVVERGAIKYMNNFQLLSEILYVQLLSTISFTRTPSHRERLDKYDRITYIKHSAYSAPE